MGSSKGAKNLTSSRGQGGGQLYPLIENFLNPSSPFFYLGGNMSEKEDIKHEYSYKSTIKKKYNLTDYQIDQAIEKCIIKDYKYVQNPYYRSKKSLIINNEELLQHLEEIRKLEKYSENEINKRKEYNKRSRKVSKISFYCPICNAKIRPLRDSYTRDAVLKDEIDYENAKKVVIVTHFRHIHTDYDKIRKSVELYRYYDGPIEKILDLKIDSSKLVDKLKEEKTKEAIELAKKHGLLPPNFSKEEYDRIALKIKRMYGLT